MGIRVLDHPILHSLIEGLGNPIFTTTALLDRDNEPSIDGFDVNDIFCNQVELVTVGGQIIPNPSTVVSLIDDMPEVLREGKEDISLFQ